MAKKILIAEISGKRPGTKEERPTERFSFNYDKLIISNNSDGYQSDWNIVMVPDDYQKWYQENVKMHDTAYFAPMNRSYAIKYAREHGYDYLVQLDDNILSFGIRYRFKDGREYSTLKSTPDIEELPNDMFAYFADILDHTNAGIVGMNLAGASVPSDDWLAERYVYSAFMLNLSRVPDHYQGDFEDDIEFRLKLKQMNIPMIEVAPFQYIKTAQSTKGDTSGNRAAYVEAGIKRGEHMSKLYGEYYSRGFSSRGSGTTRKEGKKAFRHKLKAFKVGVRLSDLEYLKDQMGGLLTKYATYRPDSLTVKITKPKYYINVHLLDESKRYDLLYDLLDITIASQSQITLPRHGKNVENIYTIVTEEAETEDGIMNFLHGWIESGGVEVVED